MVERLLHTQDVTSSNLVVTTIPFQIGVHLTIALQRFLPQDSRVNISCRPSGLFNWNFELESETDSALLKTKGFAEQGSLTFKNRFLEIKKEGLFAGEWHLLENGEVVAHASKPHLFTRRFVITFSDQEWTLEPTGLGRSMILHGPDNETLTIAPEHPFTSRATIQGEGATFLQAAFAFWLTVLIWRRASNSSSG